jgi:hypothetical protein
VFNKIKTPLQRKNESAPSLRGLDVFTLDHLVSLKMKSEGVRINAVDEIEATRQNPANTKLLIGSAGLGALATASSKLLEIMFRNRGTTKDAAMPTVTLRQIFALPSSVTVVIKNSPLRRRGGRLT